MGLLDSFAKQMLGGAISGQSNRITDVLGGLLDQVGGLEGLLSKARSAGLESTVLSWISTGTNQTISPGQMADVLGANTVQAAADKLGFGAQQLLPLLAQFFPVIIDKLTPNGRIEQGANGSADLDLGKAIAGVLGSTPGGGLGGLLGGLLSRSKLVG